MRCCTSGPLESCRQDILVCLRERERYELRARAVTSGGQLHRRGLLTSLATSDQRQALSMLPLREHAGTCIQHPPLLALLHSSS